jgi:general secretion pathway protein G
VYINDVSKEDEMIVFERVKIKYACGVSRVDAQGRTVLRPDRRGFSLVELITVMGVVAALATMALPAYTGYLKSVRNGRCVADLRTIDKAVTAYTLDNGSPPPGNNLSIIGVASTQFDPWGRAFIYQNLAAAGAAPREDFLGNPLNTDYDLYSTGWDGVSGQGYNDPGSGNDIARHNNGIFIGLRNPDAP